MYETATHCVVSVTESNFFLIVIESNCVVSVPESDFVVIVPDSASVVSVPESDLLGLYQTQNVL